MKYDSEISQVFGLVFFVLVLSGLLLTINPVLALITLSTAFFMNAILYAALFFASIYDFYQYSVDVKDIHP